VVLGLLTPAAGWCVSVASVAPPRARFPRFPLLWLGSHQVGAALWGCCGGARAELRGVLTRKRNAGERVHVCADTVVACDRLVVQGDGVACGRRQVQREHQGLDAHR
jgi:hypothetical protein